MKRRKVCPFAVRNSNSRREILVFRHPVGNDIQLVKGTVEENEDLAAAAVREFSEESGISELAAVEFKGSLEINSANQIRHFFLCRPALSLPEQWAFFANDDGGHDFAFFWFDLDAQPSAEWHPVFREALRFILTRI